MKRIVADTNIVFSAVLNSDGKIGDLIFSSASAFEFFTCSYMKAEIQTHKLKLLKISGLSELQIQIALERILEEIKLIDVRVISDNSLARADKLLIDIDPDDAFFLALTFDLKGYLWTGDNVLYNGLKRKGYNKIYSTSELWEQRINLEHKRTRG
jgi:predicted nucleic acid-binding protein